MTFNYNSARVFKAAQFYKTMPAKLIKFWRILFLALAVVSLLLYSVLAYYVPYILNTAGQELASDPVDTFSFLLGIFYLAIIPGLSIVFFELFFNSYYKKNPIRISENESLPEGFNIADIFSFDAASIFLNALDISRKSGSAKLQVAELIKASIQSPALEPLFFRLSIISDILVKEFERQASIPQKLAENVKGIFKFGDPAITEEIQNVILETFEVFKSHKDNQILASDLLVSLAKKNQPLRTALAQVGIEEQDVQNLSIWYETLARDLEQKKRFWDKDNLLRGIPIGRTWIFGYTPLLNTLSTDYGLIALQSRLKAKPIGRENIIRQIETIFSRAGENNVLLVGDDGVGKETVMLGFAEMVALGKTVPVLNYKRVLKLDIQLLASRFKTTAEVQAALIKILEEAKGAGNIIMVIDDLHNYVQPGESVGRIDVSELLIPYMRSSNFQILAATNLKDFHKYIEINGALMNSLSRINVEEPGQEQTLRIVQQSLPRIERQTGAFFTYQAIKAAVIKSDKYIMDKPYPEKAIELLEEASALVNIQNNKIITEKDIDQILSVKINAPVGVGNQEEKDILLNLEQLIHERLVNQEEAVRVIAESMRRTRSGISKSTKPIGSFLFLGPTGVGKTETSKVLAKTYFGSPDRMIRFDMSEYQDVSSIGRFIGSMDQNEPGQFVSAVRDRPFSLILLDEIEKAHKNILNLFLQVLDEGHITDIYGRRVNLSQTIIICTSNAGSNEIRKMVNQNLDPASERSQLIDFLLEKAIFSPEFLNRFDAVVIYHPLNQENVLQISRILLEELKKRLAQQNYDFSVTDKIVEFIAKAGFEPEFGARPMQRAIQDTVESMISKMILENSIQKGVGFTISGEDLEKVWIEKNAL